MANATCLGTRRILQKLTQINKKVMLRRNNCRNIQQQFCNQSTQVSLSNRFGSPGLVGDRRSVNALSIS
jgi:hypothetical protein